MTAFFDSLGKIISLKIIFVRFIGVVLKVFEGVIGTFGKTCVFILAENLIMVLNSSVVASGIEKYEKLTDALR